MLLQYMAATKRRVVYQDEQASQSKSSRQILVGVMNPGPSAPSTKH